MSAQTVNDTNFATEVLSSDQPVLVDFYAPWCGPCRRMHPVIDSLSGELAGQAKVVKVNVDEAPNVAMKYGISAIPHFAVFRGGQQTWSHTGLASKESLVQAVQ